jgi:hypothetical protein
MRLLFVAAFLLASMCCAQERPKKVSLPLEVKEEMKCSFRDPAIEGKSWFRWTSDNFVVCSLNDTHAQYLHSRLERVKDWAFSRWGLYGMDFAAECRLICVDDPVLFKKLFNLDETKVEIRRDDNGKIEISVIFMLINSNPSAVVPVPVTEVCYAEFEQKYNSRFSWWAVRGMSLLNGSVVSINRRLLALGNDLSQNKPMYFSQSLMATNKSEWEQLSMDKRSVFDRNAMAFCLLLRKEFGQSKLHWMINKTANGNDGEAALRELLDFKSYSEFDQSFKRYMEDLTRDVASGKTPMSYLQIEAAK